MLENVWKVYNSREKVEEEKQKEIKTVRYWQQLQHKSISPEDRVIGAQGEEGFLMEQCNEEQSTIQGRALKRC